MRVTAGILFICYFSSLLLRANEVLRRQIVARDTQSTFLLAASSLVLSAHCVALYMLRAVDLPARLLFSQPSGRPNFSTAIWMAASCDVFVTCAVIAFKGALVLWRHLRRPPCPGAGMRLGRRRDGLLLTAVEHGALLCRTALPAPVWCRYFLDASLLGRLFSSVAAGLYMTYKILLMGGRLSSFAAALRAATGADTVSYGKLLAPADLVETGDNSCAICCETMRAPIKLHSCSHVFCDACVSEWFERERTCPLCRCVINTVSVRSFGDGTTTLLLHAW